MKLKAVIHEECPAPLLKALESKELREMVLERVLRRHLRVGNFGPAEFYIQKCDIAVASDPMCEVRLTGVSVNKRRATEDFRSALAELELVYKEVIEVLLDPNEKLQLFVSLMLDQAPFGETSSLLEREPIYVLSKNQHTLYVPKE